MNDEAAMAQPRLQLSVQPPSRVGNVLGWSLLALGVACLISSLAIGIRAESAWRSAQALPIGTMSAYTTYVAAEAAYHTATVRACLSFIAGCLCLSTVPGLLYGLRPSLLGGPVGRLLRIASAKLASHYPARKHPIMFYQGLGMALPGVGWTAFFLATIVTTLAPSLGLAGLWVILSASLLMLGANFMSFPLASGSWWFTTRRRDLDAEVGDRRIESARGDG